MHFESVEGRRPSHCVLPLPFLRVVLVVIAALLVTTGCDNRDSLNTAAAATTGAPSEATTSIAASPTPGEEEAETAAGIEETAVSPAVDAAAVTPSGESLHLVWQTETGAPINHPPLPVGASLIVVPEKGPLFALEPESGRLRWQYDPPERVWDRAYASDGRFLYVGVEGGKLVSLDAETGQVAWERTLGIDVQVPPLVVAEVLYVPSTFVGPGLSNDPDGKAKLFALNSVDGSERWQFESGNYILQTPFLAGDTLYAAGVFSSPEPLEEGGHTRLYALTAADGKEKWTYESEDGFAKQLYANDAAVAYIGYQDFANGVDSETGELRWRRDTGNWVPTLSGYGDTIYFGSANTIVHALNVADGNVVWEHNIEEGTFNYVLGAPRRIGDEIFFLSQHGDIMALNAVTGAALWRVPTGVTARTGLSVSGAWIFFGDEEGIVYGYDGR